LQTLAALEKQILEWALQKAKGNVERAAQSLRMTPQRFRQRMQEYRLVAQEER
jgi:DNA-binding NtrC family response regulator